jgi:magnesium-transporting ATPase (P-type)
LLLLAAFVSLIIGIINDGFENGWIEGSSIFLAVFIITIVTVSNNFAKEKQFQKLQQSQRTSQKVTVLRNNGAMKEISS